MSADDWTQPDLLDELAAHNHASGCDFQDGYLTALRRAASYVQDYAHDNTIAARVQAPILRSLAIADCAECNAVGCVIDNHGRHVEHHPLGGAS